MSVYANDQIDKIVAIDQNHSNLVASLVACHKPKRVLELGFGAGESCRAILRGLAYNQCPFEFELVDCWFDFAGAPPAEIEKPDYAQVKFITSTEEDFVRSCSKRYDFIFSDADHLRTQDWSQHVYDNLLDRDGILIYHDVSNTRLFPNLLRLYEDAIRLGYHHMLFNKNSRKGEACDRGLLVIFKH